MNIPEDANTVLLECSPFNRGSHMDAESDLSGSLTIISSSSIQLLTTGVRYKRSHVLKHRHRENTLTNN